MSNWTKGPLVVSAPDSIGTVVTGPRGVSVAWFGCGMSVGADGSYSISPAEAHANAKLYAAAPELVEVLQAIVFALDLTDMNIGPSAHEVLALRTHARAALSKAGA